LIPAHIAVLGLLLAANDLARRSFRSRAPDDPFAIVSNVTISPS
jgi:hypothetical protein